MMSYRQCFSIDSGWNEEDGMSIGDKKLGIVSKKGGDLGWDRVGLW